MPAFGRGRNNEREKEMKITHIAMYVSDLKAARDFFVQYFDAVLLENHGVLTWSDDLMSAYMKMESLEFYAELLYRTSLMGGADVFTKEQIEELVKVRHKMGISGKYPADRTGENCYKCKKCFWKE